MINLEPETTIPPPSVPPADPPPSEFVDQKIDSVPIIRPWHLTYYHSYFDVSTFTVLLRLQKTVNPLAPNDFFEGSSPDFYCPIWICFTLVFVFTAGGNLAEYTDSIDTIDWVANLTKTTAALLLFFGLLFSIPLLCRYLLYRIDSQPSFPCLLSLYGYSLVLYIPAGILCSFPIHWGRAVVLSVAAAWSAGLMGKNYWREFESTGGKKRWVVAGLVGAGHAAIVVSGVLYFFS